MGWDKRALFCGAFAIATLFATVTCGTSESPEVEPVDAAIDTSMPRPGADARAESAVPDGTAAADAEKTDGKIVENTDSSTDADTDVASDAVADALADVTSDARADAGVDADADADADASVDAAADGAADASALHCLDGSAPSFDAFAPEAGSSAVLHYRFDDGAGTTAIDSSGQGRNGTLDAPTWVAGRFSGALEFDRIAYDRVSVTTQVFWSTNVSVEAWVRPRYQHGVIFRSDTTGVSVWILDQKFWFRIGNGTLWTDAIGPVIALDAWYHVVGTYDGATIRLYQNGALVASTAQTGTPPQAFKLYVGGELNDYPFHGTIDDVLVSGETRTAEQVADRYEQGIGCP